MSYLSPQTRTYLFQTLDPLHMGTGGTRLGRVDNTVSRDPVSRLPKAPGTGISGAVKDAYDLHTLVAAVGRVDPGHRCAGSQGCGKPGCRVCTLFGQAPSEASQAVSRRGLVAFRDAAMVAVPMASMTGPVFLTTDAFARKLGYTGNQPSGLSTPNMAAPTGVKTFEGAKVNLGSFLFDSPATQEIEINESMITEKLAFINGMSASDIQKITDRLAACHAQVFPLLAETALEVRTSVTIDPKTGAAEKNKLFTYEAVPAGAIFETDLNFLGGPYPVDAFGDPETAETLFQDIETYGFPYLAMTGMGGNVTRGFGRVRFLGYWK